MINESQADKKQKTMDIKLLHVNIMSSKVTKVNSKHFFISNPCKKTFNSMFCIIKVKQLLRILELFMQRKNTRCLTGNIQL